MAVHKVGLDRSRGTATRAHRAKFPLPALCMRPPCMAGGVMLRKDRGGFGGVDGGALLFTPDMPTATAA